MRVAFPTERDLGLESLVYGHFGSTPLFIVVEVENDGIDTVVNRNREHEHGRCEPLAALGGDRVDAVAVGGIGPGALRKLTASGIRVYRAVEGTVRENLALVRRGKLPELTLDQTCAGHGGRGACAH
jgi:predicted Fe-Mo cluster-binding NifX family protein